MRHPSVYILLIFGVVGLVLPPASQRVVAQKDSRQAESRSSKSNSAGTQKSTAKKTATKKTTTKRTGSKTSSKKRAGRVSLTPGREAAAMTFARLHHPELADLLVKLKRKKAKQYGQAVRQLFNTSERLARAEERSPDRYELELAAWKLDSRIRLLAARMTMNSGSKLDSELKGLLKSRADVRLKQLTKERERLAGRLSRVDRLIERINSNPEASIQGELQRIKRSFVAKRQRTKKPSSRPVVAPIPRPNKPRGKPKRPL